MDDTLNTAGVQADPKWWEKWRSAVKGDKEMVEVKGMLLPCCAVVYFLQLNAWRVFPCKSYRIATTVHQTKHVPFVYSFCCLHGTLNDDSVSIAVHT